jgi:hypothetical protein
MCSSISAGIGDASMSPMFSAALCNTDVATIIVKNVSNFKRQPYAKIGNPHFSTPNNRSTIFLVLMWLSLYSCSAGVPGFRRGVIKYVLFP